MEGQRLRPVIDRNVRGVRFRSASITLAQAAISGKWRSRSSHRWQFRVLPSGQKGFVRLVGGRGTLDGACPTGPVHTVEKQPLAHEESRIQAIVVFGP